MEGEKLHLSSCSKCFNFWVRRRGPWPHLLTKNCSMLNWWKVHIFVFLFLRLFFLFICNSCLYNFFIWNIVKTSHCNYWRFIQQKILYLLSPELSWHVDCRSSNAFNATNIWIAFHVNPNKSCFPCKQVGVKNTNFEWTFNS